MKDPMTDAFESLERAHIESGARMMWPASRAEELIADLEAEIVKRDARIAELNRDNQRLREALQAIYDTDYQVPHASTDAEISMGKKLCIFRIRKLAQTALRQ